MRYEDEIFGTEPQQTVSMRARDLWHLIPNDPQLRYNGRIVTVTGYIGQETGEKLISLARLQGATTCHFLPKNRTQAVQQSIETRGLSCNIWEFCKGRELAYKTALRILETHKLPEDISVERLTTDTDTSRIADFAAMTGKCGVLVMSGRVIRGLDVPGITLAGIDQSGKTVASAWGYKCYHSQSEFSDYAFWGGLSCRKDRRGQKIALILGALSIVKLWEDMHVRGFCTGIAEDNAASFALCKKLGILPSNDIALGVTDPAMFKGATLTK